MGVPDGPQSGRGGRSRGGVIVQEVSGFLARIVLLFTVIGATGLLVGAMFLPAAMATDDLLTTVRSEVLDVPPLGEASTPPQNSYLFAADGSQLAELSFEENRVPIPLAEIPESIRLAVLATEDADFYEHEGVNHLAIVRTALNNFRAGSIQGGASTITQQYVKQTFLTPEQTLARKIQEAIYATQLERRLSKDEILERYLNRVYFGSGVYGLGTAAERYFSMEVHELTLDRAAMLAGIIRSPERNNPIVSPENALARRNIVLGQMASQGFITDEQARVAAERDLNIKITEPPLPNEPLWVDWITRLLISEDVANGLGTQRGALEAMGGTPEERRARVYQTGVRIHTTLDPELQALAQQALDEHLSVPDASPAQLAREPRGAIASIDPETGAIVAMAQGPHPWGSCVEDGEWADETDEGELLCHKTKVNTVVPGAGASGRQPGSSYKPLIIAAALEDGVPPTLQMDGAGPTEIEGCLDEGQPWEVGNFAESGDGQIMDMYEAVRRSNNVYHAKLIAEIGPEKAVEMSRKLGITSPHVRADCSLSLGAADLMPLEMASAYATLANRGVYCAPFPISRIEDAAGEIIWEHRPDCAQTIDTEVADRVVDIMAGPVGPGGTAPRADLGAWPTRGKTGTTDQHRDAWFVGFIRQLATATWIGYPADTRYFVDSEAAAAVCGDEPWFRPGESGQCPGQTKFLSEVTIAGEYYARVTGGSLPATIWRAYMAPAAERFEPEAFPEPGPLPTGSVPDVVSAGSISRAEQIAQEAGFRLRVEEVDDWRSAGTFVDQDPPAGTTHPLGSSIVLQVSNGSGEVPTVPDVVGMTLDEAIAVMVEAGYEVATEEVPTDDPESVGRILATSPRPGSTLEPGEGVVVVLVVGGEPLEEPEPEEPTEPEPTEPTEPEPTEPTEPEPSPTEDDDGDGQGRGPDGGGPPGQG
jgi:membrane peptidoglycan carboxypeptidase